MAQVFIPIGIGWLVINNPAVTDTERIHNHELRSQHGRAAVTAGRYLDIGYIWKASADLDILWPKADECGIGATNRASVHRAWQIRRVKLRLVHDNRAWYCHWRQLFGEVNCAKQSAAAR